MFNIGAGTDRGKVYGFICPERLPFPLGFPITDTATNICCVPRTCSGQAGVPGNGAQPSVGAAFKLAAGPARMDLTAQAVMW